MLKFTITIILFIIGWHLNAQANICEDDMTVTGKPATCSIERNTTAYTAWVVQVGSYSDHITSLKKTISFFVGGCHVYIYAGDAMDISGPFYTQYEARQKAQQLRKLRDDEGNLIFCDAFPKQLLEFNKVYR